MGGAGLTLSEAAIVIICASTLGIFTTLVAAMPAYLIHTPLANAPNTAPGTPSAPIFTPGSVLTQGFTAAANSTLDVNGQLDTVLANLHIVISWCRSDQFGGTCLHATANGVLSQSADTIGFFLEKYSVASPFPNYPVGFLDWGTSGLCSNVQGFGGNFATVVLCNKALDANYHADVKEDIFGGQVLGYVFTTVFTYNTTAFATPSAAWAANALHMFVGVPAAPTNQGQASGWQIIWQLLTFQAIDVSIPLLSYLLSLILYVPITLVGAIIFFRLIP